MLNSRGFICIWVVYSNAPSEKEYCVLKNCLGNNVGMHRVYWPTQPDLSSILLLSVGLLDFWSAWGKIKFVVFDHSYILWERRIFREGLLLLSAAGLLASGR